MRKFKDMTFEESKEKMEELGMGDMSGYKEVLKVLTAEDWFESEEAKEWYSGFSNVLSQEKFYFKKHSFELDNEKYYIMKQEAYGKPIVYRYFEKDGVRRLQGLSISTCIHNGGCDEACILFDRMIEIIPKNWANTKANWEIFKKTQRVIYR